MVNALDLMAMSPVFVQEATIGHPQPEEADPLILPCSHYD